MNNEENILADIDIEEKISATENPTLRVAARKFLEESCEMTKMLPPDKRMLFVMHYSHGFSITEIANLCNVTPQAVTKRLREITEELNGMRNCMSRTDEDGEVDKSTRERIELYFREQAKRKRSNKESKDKRTGI